MNHYKVVVSDSIEDLEDQVDKLMRQYLRWMPIGGIAVLQTNEGVKYYQAMQY